MRSALKTRCDQWVKRAGVALSAPVSTLVYLRLEIVCCTK